ncbi:DUF2500 domain-containing protein [Neobacillus sp. 179-C4.2 HS]|uniref:DUF2500 domain-containing protein n=1 Tax=Neobacillus driksii TaxID=3035913 RepID=A0ABV4YSA0_9BACI|nr:DUF2500 domain-containing protein [Neobacillus sp. 179.-C4.2 HS]MDP5197038.1 DUF2500 domain-containing protein [Neobacillus sp. 179.-C4.2 HS]
MEVNQGFDMFTIIEKLFPLFFILVIGFILFIIFQGIKQWNYNNKQPKLNVDALVVSKRTEVSGGSNDSSASTWYYITFQVESGDRMELAVRGSDYGMLAEGDAGELVFQGTRFHSFTRKQQVN